MAFVAEGPIILTVASLVASRPFLLFSPIEKLMNPTTHTLQPTFNRVVTHLLILTPSFKILKEMVLGSVNPLYDST